LLPVLRLAAGFAVRALVVDDHGENRAVLGRMLAAVGCQVTYASDGQGARTAIGDTKPDIVFLDLLLPDVNGADLARMILAESGAGAPKLVAHTASTLAAHREAALAAGCVDCVLKPFECDHIYRGLERWLGVRFERAEAPGESVAVLPLERLTLPDELYARLMVAAELHSTTALKCGLQELRQLGPEPSRLADQIRLLMRSYDMDGIQRLLAQVAHPPTHSASAKV